MNKLILISGDLASGKSTLAKSLSKYLLIPCFTKDEIKEKYVDMYGFKTREENRALSVKAVQYMIEAFKRFAKEGKDIILEANFREDELNQIYDLSVVYNVEVIFYLLRGEIPVLFERFLARLPNRHIAHQSMHLDQDINSFSDYVLSIRNINYPFIPHIIDTTNKDDMEVLNIAISYLNNN